jgi:hypothetical protein
MQRRTRLAGIAQLLGRGTQARGREAQGEFLNDEPFHQPLRIGKSR